MDAQSLLESFGYIVVLVAVFIESGVLLGLILPLPSSSLMFTAGVFAASGKLDAPLVILAGVVGAILGYVAGYFTGLKYGRKLFYEKATDKYFTEQQGRNTEKFMKKYGYSTLVIGRFLPVIHSIAPLLSGVSKTPLKPFMVANVAGAILWVTITVSCGYYIGQSVPNAPYYLIPFLVLSALLMNSPIGKKLLARFTKKIEDM